MDDSHIHITTPYWHICFPILFQTFSILQLYNLRLILIVNIYSSCQMSPKRVCSSKRKCMIHFRMTIFIFIEGNIIVRHIRNDVFTWFWLFVRPKSIWPPPPTIWSKNNLNLEKLTNKTRLFNRWTEKSVIIFYIYNFWKKK